MEDQGNGGGMKGMERGGRGRETNAISTCTAKNGRVQRGKLSFFLFLCVSEGAWGRGEGGAQKEEVKSVCRGHAKYWTGVGTAQGTQCVFGAVFWAPAAAIKDNKPKE